MIITESHLLENGYEKYIGKTDYETALIKSLDAVIVRRNKGIDGFLKSHVGGKPVPVKIQTKHETIEDCIEKIEKASQGKDYELKIVIQTKLNKNNSRLFNLNSNVEIIKSNLLSIKEMQESTVTNTA
jgi:site-specific DNA-methyltransferase (adenine-specific)